MSACTACGACCACFRVDFAIYEMEDMGGSVPTGLAVEVNGSTMRMRGTDHVPIRCAALTGRVGGLLEARKVAILAEGFSAAGVPVFAADVKGDLSGISQQGSFGEKLTVPVFVEPGAAIGSRVLRLRVPGASTDAQATPANTVTIVAPQ